MSYTITSSTDWFIPTGDPVIAIKQRYSTEAVVLFQAEDLTRFLVRINLMWYYGHINLSNSVYVSFSHGYPDFSAEKAWARHCWEHAMSKTNAARREYEERIQQETEALVKFNSTS